MKNLLFVLVLFLAGLPLFTQAQDSATKNKGDIGIELQAYPTGIIPGVRGAIALGSRNEINIRLGAQFIDHRDLGVHESEKGNGAGITLGFRRYFKDLQQGFFLGARNDVWFNSIDWKDNIGLANERSGHSDIVVIQPTAEAGYLFMIGENATIAPALGFGYEVNVQTRGEDTGEGAILLVGVSLGYRLR